jgi:regulatory protein
VSGQDAFRSGVRERAAGPSDALDPAGLGARPDDAPADPQRDCPPGDAEQVARLILLRRLEAGPRTRGELAQALARRGVPDDAAKRVLDRFVEVGLIDDPLFARMWVQSRLAGRHLSRRALRQELAQRGVPVEDIDAALTDVSDEQERAAALEFARRRARATVGLPRPVRVRRMAGALARRGYPPGLAHWAVREALAQEVSAGETSAPQHPTEDDATDEDPTGVAWGGEEAWESPSPAADLRAAPARAD